MTFRCAVERDGRLIKGTRGCNIARTFVFIILAYLTKNPSEICRFFGFFLKFWKNKRRSAQGREKVGEERGDKEAKRSAFGRSSFGCLRFGCFVVWLFAFWLFRRLAVCVLVVLPFGCLRFGRFAVWLFAFWLFRRLVV